MDSTPVRVMLWSVPRSLSTVFEKCMGYFPNTQIVNEPFACAYHMGPESRYKPSDVASEDKIAEHQRDLESIKVDLPMAFDADACTYDFVKRQLEADYPGKDLVFCKDMAYALDEKYDKIPTGYRHTFLIRNPYRTFPSYKKMMSKFTAFLGGGKDFRLPDLPRAMFPKGYCVKEQYDLVTYFRENGEPNPIIIDADDLLANPASVLRQYSALLGIPFTDKQLEWPAGKEAMKSWKGARELILGNLNVKTGGYYDTALDSSHYHPPRDMPRREDLSEDILECADVSMPYYQKMYKMRIKP